MCRAHVGRVNGTLHTVRYFEVYLGNTQSSTSFLPLHVCTPVQLVDTRTDLPLGYPILIVTVAMAGHGSEIFVVGASNMDLIAYVPRFPKEGETLHGSKFETGFGGKGANQAVMAAKLGGAVGMLTCVGDDAFGPDTVENYKKNGVNCKHVYTIGGVATGVAPIFVNEQGQNCIVIVNGANDRISTNHVDIAKDAITSAKVLVCQLEIPVETSMEALKIAKGAGVMTIFNPAPARADLPDELFKSCDIIAPNEPEAELLTGEKVDSKEGALRAAKVLLDKGCSTVLMTLGSRGCLLVSHENVDDPLFIPVPQETVEVKDTSGAGDCFIGALAFYISKGFALPEACRRACFCASVSVGGEGTQSSFPSRSALPEEIRG